MNQYRMLVYSLSIVTSHWNLRQLHTNKQSQAMNHEIDYRIPRDKFIWHFNVYTCITLLPVSLYSLQKKECMEVMLLHQQSLVYHPTISEYYGMFCALIINC